MLAAEGLKSERCLATPEAIRSAALMGKTFGASAGAGFAGDDERPRNAREIARQALCDPIHEIVLLGPAAEV